jgi:voltage-gated sodium channel
LHSGWDIFDIAVTLVSVIPSFGMLSAFRAPRLIRILRLISFIPHGQAMVDALLGALRNMAAAFVVMGVVFYSFVVITTNLFRDVDPVHYGTLGRSAAHHYMVMVSLGSSLESESVLTGMPWALPLFAAFIIVASFGLLNMFIAVLVAALKEQLEQETIREERARFDRLEQKLDALAVQLADQRRMPAE